MRRSLDMTNGTLVDKMLFYALPLAATGILQQLFNAADIAVVGRFVGTDAMAAVGSNSAIIGLLVNMFAGISLGTNVVIAHAAGKGDKEKVRMAVHTSVVIAFILGVVLTFCGELASSYVLAMTGVPDSVLDMAVRYLRVYLAGMPAIILYNFEAAIFRGSGNTKTPLLVLSVSGVVNVVLNLLFVVGLHMSVAGVALATILSNLVSAVVLFCFLLRDPGMLRLEWGRLKIDRHTLAEVLQIGLPSGIQSSLFSFANIIIQSAINSLGAAVMAASSAAFNMEIFAYYVMNAFAQTCTTFVGQNYGAGKLGRCKKILKLSLLLDYIFTVLVCGLILFFGHTLLSVFNGDPQVVEVGYQRLCIIFFAYLFSIWQEVGSGYLRGFGRSFVPAAVSLAGICGVRMVWIFTVFRMHPTFTVIMAVYPLSLFLTGAAILTAAIRFQPERTLQWGSEWEPERKSDERKC